MEEDNRTNRVETNVELPWQTLVEWKQIQLSFKAVSDRHTSKSGSDEKIFQIKQLAGKIRKEYHFLSAPINQICDITCKQCHDICCLKATIWYDFKDLLYLYFGQERFPESQIYKIKTGEQAGCCNLAATGCFRTRFERPFVCTWYFCAEQKALLSHENPLLKARVDASLARIKDFRNQMEELFIRSAL